tara:strand:+ start:445 stop:576 length:132 start_codon:yes stop_codon:yes gene_type:complete
LIDEVEEHSSVVHDLSMSANSAMTVIGSAATQAQQLLEGIINQ